MADPIDNFDVWLSQRTQSQEFAFDKWLQEKAQGGAIKADRPFDNPSAGGDRFPLGATIGGVGGAILGGPAGAIGGAMAGDVAQSAIETATNSPNAPSNAVIGTLRTAGEGLSAAAGEVAAVGSNIARRAGMKNLLKRTEPGPYQPYAPGAEKAIEFTQANVPNVQPALLRSEATGGRIDGALHALAETGIVPSSRLQNYLNNRHQEFTQAARDFGDQISRTPMTMEERSELVLRAAEREKGLYNSAAGVYYNHIREKVTPTTKQVFTESGVKELESGGLVVDLRPLRQKYIKDLRAVEGVDDPQGMLGKQAITQLFDKGDYAQWSDLEPVLKQMRSESRRIEQAVNVGGASGKEKAPGAAKLDSIANSLDDVMGEALKKVPATEGSAMSLYDTWKIARGMARTAHQDFNNELLRSLTKSALYNAKGGNLTVAKTLYEAKEPDIIRQAMRPLDEAEKTEIRKGAWEYAWQQSVAKLKGGVDMVKASDLRQYLYGKTDLDIKRANEFFTPQQRKWIDGYLATIEKQQERLLDPLSPVMIQVKQSGAVAEVSGAALVGLGVQAGEKVSKGKVATGLALLFTPQMAANLLLRPTTAELFTQLSKYPVNSYAFGATLKRLTLFDEGVARLVQGAISTQLVPQATGAAADMIQQGTGMNPFPNFK